MPQRLHLEPGYTVDLAHLRRPVTLADDLTLRAVCESLERMEPGQRAALEAILGYPLALWLNDCRRTVPPDAGTGAGLLEIRLYWRCESSASCTGARPWPTRIRLDVEAAMASLAAAYPPETRAAKAYALYEQFRLDMPAGTQDWDAAGPLDLDAMRALADDTTVNTHRTRPRTDRQPTACAIDACMHDETLASPPRW